MQSSGNKNMLNDTMDFNDFTPGNDGFGSADPSAFTPINGQGNSGVSPNTVSPNDLFMDSAPNSNALTNLTTPSMYDGSPDAFDSFDTSPFLNDTNHVGSSHWPSLFEHEDAQYAPAEMVSSSSTESLANQQGVNLASVSKDRPVSSASMTSPQERPSTGHRMSLSSGITKNRRTGRALPPIEVEEGDSKALKRAKNTMAARKSRQKKRDIEETLRQELAEMTAARDRWMHIAIKHGAPLPETTVPSRNTVKDEA